MDFCSAGGLVTAVAPVVVDCGGLWIGWSGLHTEEPLESIPESDPDDKAPTAGLLSKQVQENKASFFEHLPSRATGQPVAVYVGVEFSSLSLGTLWFTYDNTTCTYCSGPKFLFSQYLSHASGASIKIVSLTSTAVSVSVCNKSIHGERISMNLENFKTKCLAIAIVL